MLGLIAHAIEKDLRTRRDDDLELGCLSFDILGTIPIGTVTIEVTVIRPGRTIELVEARLLHDGRAAVLARAWLMRGYNTRFIEGTSFLALPPPEALPPWEMDAIWAGGFIGSLEVRREDLGLGRARAWLRTNAQLVAQESASSTARALALVDVADGVAPRISPELALFPNLDLTVHLFRRPTPGWFGLDTTVSIGFDGIGLTHSVLHGLDGVIGTVVQCLTVRPIIQQHRLGPQT